MDWVVAVCGAARLGAAKWQVLVDGWALENMKFTPNVPSPLAIKRPVSELAEHVASTATSCHGAPSARRTWPATLAVPMTDGSVEHPSDVTIRTARSILRRQSPKTSGAPNATVKLRANQYKAQTEACAIYKLPVRCSAGYGDGRYKPGTWGTLHHHLARRECAGDLLNREGLIDQAACMAALSTAYYVLGAVQTHFHHPEVRLTSIARACPSCSTPLPDAAQFCFNCGRATPTEPGVPTRLAATDEIEVANIRQALSSRYRVERVLGEGGMATVYLAEDLKHHRKVAVKVMRPSSRQRSASIGSCAKWRLPRS